MKSQAEIAGHLTRGDPEHPQIGTVLRDLELLLADGTNDARRLLSSLRGRSNLVMIFTAGHDLTAFTAGLAGNAEALKENNARVLVITPAAGAPSSASSPPHPAALTSAATSHATTSHTTTSHAAPSHALARDVSALDPDGEIHRLLGASDAAGNLAPTIYVTDRFGEIFAAFHNAKAAALPSPAEIIRWLEFINQQCEECSPPEWPE
jgi:hypothetical protein